MRCYFKSFISRFSVNLYNNPKKYYYHPSFTDDWGTQELNKVSKTTQSMHRKRELFQDFDYEAQALDYQVVFLTCPLGLRSWEKYRKHRSDLQHFSHSFFW